MLTLVYEARVGHARRDLRRHLDFKLLPSATDLQRGFSDGRASMRRRIRMTGLHGCLKRREWEYLLAQHILVAARRKAFDEVVPEVATVCSRARVPKFKEGI